MNRPGGTCQISLGGYTEAELERMRELREAREAAKKATHTGAENEKKVATNASPIVGKITEQKSVVASTSDTVPPLSAPKHPRISSNAFASSSTTNSFNVLTDRPTSKVSNPPGGRTNFTLG